MHMPSKITTTVPVRVKNEHVAVIDEMIRLGVFKDRSEAVRTMIAPVYEMLATGWNTNSKTQAVKARFQCEAEVMKKLNVLLKASDELELTSEELPQPA